MYTPSDISHLSRLAARHTPATEATRIANRQRRAMRRDALRALADGVRNALISVLRAGFSSRV